MYALFGRIAAHEGQRDALAGILQESAARMGEAPGCFVYIVHADEGDPHGVWIYEAWSDAEAHRGSLALPFVQQAIAAARPLIAGMSDRRELTPLAGLGLPGA